jgi:hypothetical protein
VPGDGVLQVVDDMRDTAIVGQPQPRIEHVLACPPKGAEIGKHWDSKLSIKTLADLLGRIRSLSVRDSVRLLACRRIAMR